MSESMCPKCREMVSTNYGAVHRCKDRLWSAKYNPEPSDLTLKVESYESRIAELEDQLAAAEADAGRYQDVLQKIQSWCEAYPLDIFPEPDWDEVKSRLGPKLLTRVSASNMRHVIEGVAKLCKTAPEQEDKNEHNG